MCCLSRSSKWRRSKTHFSIFDKVEDGTTITINQEEQMKAVKIHPWVTMSANQILNPPKKFGWRDAKTIAKKACKWIAIVIGFILMCIAIYGAVWFAMA